jgi:hypothetical protein
LALFHICQYFTLRFLRLASKYVHHFPASSKMVHTKRHSFTKMNLWSKSFHEVETPNNCTMNSACPPLPSVQPHNLLLKTLVPLGMPCLEPSVDKVIVGTNQFKSSHRHFIYDEWVSLQVCKRLSKWFYDTSTDTVTGAVPLWFFCWRGSDRTMSWLTGNTVDTKIYVVRVAGA